MPTSMFTSKVPQGGQVPVTIDRVQQILGGGAADVEWGDPNKGRNPIDPDGKIYSWAKSKVEAMKTFRANFDTDWPAYFSMIKGDQWVNLGSPGVTPRFNRAPGYRARLNINLIRPVMDDINATIYENDPRLVLSSDDLEDMQQQYVEIMQRALDQSLYNEKFPSKARQATWNALSFGNGYLKFYFDPSANDGEGKLCIDVVPTDSLYVDKFATNLKNAKFILERSYVPLSQLKREFPDMADLLLPDTAYGSYSEQLTKDGTLNSTLNKQLQIFTPSDDNPYYADKTQFTNPPYKPSQGRTEPVVAKDELWVDDRDWETFEKQTIVGWDAWGRPIHGLQRVQRRKYPYGRLITMGGGQILQDCKNPYRVFPIYAMVQDWITPSVFYADGEPCVLAEAQREYNKRRSQLMDTAAAAANPVTFYEKDTGFVPNMLSNAPGQMIPLNPNSIDRIRRLPAPDMPSYFMSAVDLPKSDLIFQSGTGGGGRPSGRSGAAIQESVAATSKRTRLKAKQVTDFLIDCGEIAVGILQDFGTPSMMIRFMGSAKNAAFRMFDRKSPRGKLDIKVEASTEAANTRANRQQMCQWLRTLGVIDDRNTLDVLEWPGREEVMRRKGLQAPHQVPTYEGWPGLPFGGYSNSGRGISHRDGLSLAARNEPPAPQAPPGAPPPGFEPKGGGGKHKKQAGKGAPGKM